MIAPDTALAGEWLEADGLGGYASGTVRGLRTRRYHALLLASLSPPTERVVLVNGFDLAVESGGTWVSLSAQSYDPGVIAGDGWERIVEFREEPWPSWRYRLPDGRVLEQEIFLRQGTAQTYIGWRLLGGGLVRMRMRPFLSGRDYHALHHENDAFRFEPEADGDRFRWSPYDGLPPVIVHSNGRYRHEPHWYRNFLYSDERDRGLDCTEDLASPGVFEWTLGSEWAWWIASAGEPAEWDGFELARRVELDQRRGSSSPLVRAAASYVVKRGDGRTIVAGYPWFTDWGRDTFISIRGLCLATKQFDAARDILVEWAGSVSEGMLPNRFPDRGEAPEYNSVDASLWYIVAANDWLRSDPSVAEADRINVVRAVAAILDGYSKGTRFGIRMDDDGLLAAGVPGVQLTWMDAKVGDWVVTPRVGKPVEVQALWINALRIGGEFDRRWGRIADRAQQSFVRRFWNANTGGLYDVVDVNHERGHNGGSVRPNQIFAVGGLPFSLLDSEAGKSVVDHVERSLATPAGLRSLGAEESAYCGRYEGGIRERDGAYHQGTVWPWLMGPFVEAWVRVRGNSQNAKAEARRRFLEPLLQAGGTAGRGHLPEIADGNAPHRPRGCPFQAWSVAEAIRLEQLVLA